MTASRPSAAKRGYDAKWRRTRARYLASHPFCECDDCAELPLLERPVSIDVDHIDGSGPRGDNSDGNLCAMAHGHHSRKTAKRDGGFGKRIPRKRDPEPHPGTIPTP